MKQKVLSILGNGLPYGLAFFAFCALIGFIFNFPPKQYFTISGILGVVVLLMNGFVYNRFSLPLTELNAIHVDLTEMESLQFESAANHLIEDSLQPGKLVLTSQRLIFHSHPKASGGETQVEWDRRQLKPGRFHKSLSNAGGEFLLETNEGVAIMFEVNNIKEWKLVLNSKVDLT